MMKFNDSLLNFELFVDVQVMGEGLAKDNLDILIPAFCRSFITDYQEPRILVSLFRKTCTSLQEL